MKMENYKHNYLKELWWNRPWKYIPEVILMMKCFPWKKDSPNDKYRIWLRNMLYMSWQTCLESSGAKQKERTREPKPPRPPRCLCNNFIHYLFWVVSPSRLTNVMLGGGSKKAEQYVRELWYYRIKMVEYKIQNRTCTRDEWNWYRYARWTEQKV